MQTRTRVKETAPEVSPRSNGHAEQPVGPGTGARLSRELGAAFYRTFPYLILLIALGILAMVGLWARIAATNGTAETASANGAAAVSTQVMVSDFTITPATIQ